MAQYFRITGYLPEKNISFIMDSYGAYEKLWQFSAALIQKGCKIIEVSSDEKFIDGNISKLTEKTSKIILRATTQGEPVLTTYNFNSMSYTALQVGDKTYVPDKAKMV